MIFKRKNQKRSEKSSHGIWTKAVALTLALSITAGFMFETPLAAVGNDDEQYSGSVSIGDDMKVSGTNAFGSMVAGTLSEKSSQQAENNGYNVFSVEVEGTTAAVSFETRQESTLVVGIYDEDGEELLAAGTAEVTKGETETKVVIASGKMPAYFYIKAYLVEKYTQRPLCTEYTSPMYTKKMQEFLAKTTDDFEPERVLNFDSDKKTNFAVFAEDVKIIRDDEAANIPVRVNEQAREYVFENVDENITSLKQGDIFVHENNGELLIVKVSKITVDETTATVKGAEMELTDVFEHLRIDAESTADDIEVDDSDLEDGVTYLGRTDSVSRGSASVSAKPLAWQNDKEMGGSFGFEVKLEEVKTETDNLTASFSVLAKLDFSWKASLKYYIEWFQTAYIEFKLTYAAKIDAKLQGKVELSLPLADFIIPLVPGVSVKFKPALELEYSGEAGFSGKLEGVIGFYVSSDEGIKDISKSPEFTLDAQCRITVFFGVSLSPELDIGEGFVAKASVTAKMGAEIKATLKENIAGGDKETRHDCYACIDGEVSVKFKLSAKVTLLNLEKLTFKIDFLELTQHLFDFYYSYTFDQFDFTKCPHKSYLLEMKVVDSKKQPIKGATITVDGKSGETLTVNDKGIAETYLSTGTHKLTFSAYGYVAKASNIIISSSKCSAVIVLYTYDEQSDLNEMEDIFLEYAGEGSSNPDYISGGSDIKTKPVSLGNTHSAVVTTDGSLYIWGAHYFGQLGNGATSYRLVPVKIMDNVASVSLGGNHSAAITTDGSLYMWGANDYGQLGNGTTENSSTPVKIMENVAYVSLGYYHSAAITTDGSLYMWGSNESGQLGNGKYGGKLLEYDEGIDSPTPIKIMENVAQVSLGYGYSAAITTDGKLYTWGYNYTAQLGNGTNVDSYTPVKIMDNVVYVSLGDGHSGAITTDGSLYMWGYNRYGAVGDGTFNSNSIPVKIMDNVVDVSLGGGHSAAITADGSLYTWGENVTGELGNGTEANFSCNPSKIMSNVAYVSLGSGHSSAITTDGSLYTWGYNYCGQLGIGTYGGYASKTKPVKVALPPEATLTGAASTYSNHQPQYLAAAPAPKTFTGLLPNETYNYYSVKSRTVKNVMSSDNLLYIGQTVSDAKGTLTVPDYVPDGVIYVKAMKEFTVRNADITKAEADSKSVSLAWAPIDNASGYEVIAISKDGISARKKTSDTSIVMDDLTTGEVYGFIVTSIVYGEQSVPAVGDAVVIRLQSFILGDVNGSGGEPNNDDLIMLAQYLANWKVDINLEAANVDGDPNGDVNNNDLIRLAQLLAGWKF